MTDEIASQIDLSDGSPEKFPMEGFPFRLREVVEQMARVYQVPACLPAMSALAVLSGAVGKSAFVRGAYKDKQTRLNVFVVAGAERGSGKGNVAQLATPITNRSHQLAENWKHQIASDKAEAEINRAGIKKMIAEGRDKGEISEIQRRLAETEKRAARRVTLHIDNATSEAVLARLSDNDETLFCVSAEAAGALKVALGKYVKNGGTDYEWMLTAYSGDSQRVDRRGADPITLKSPCLSLLWMAQPCVIRELVANAEAVERGLTARMLLFDSGARREFDDGSREGFTKSAAWVPFIEGILDHRQSSKVYEIECEAGAGDVFTLFHNESVALGRGQFADIAGELSRWRENAIKVSGLLALAGGSTRITPETANNGCAVVRWCSTNYLGLLSAARRQRKQEELDRLLEIVRENGGEVMLGDLHRRNSVNREDIMSVIAAFPNRLKIERRPQLGIKGGRPREILKALPTNLLNPLNSPDSPTGGSLVDLVGLVDDTSEIDGEVLQVSQTGGCDNA